MENLDINSPLPESLERRFDEAAKNCLESAKVYASFTGFPAAECAHLVLGLLSTSEGLLDPLLKELYSGLRPATILESLLDILKNEADIRGVEPPSGEPPFSENAQALLSRAGVIAKEWNKEHVTIEALAFALFDKPEPLVVEAFGDAGFKSSSLTALANRLAEDREKLPAIAPVYQEGELNFDAFGRVTRDALRMLAKIAASESDRNLRDIDLIYCLFAQSDSLMIEALHVMGAQVPAMRSQLATIVGPAAINAEAYGLKAERMTRLLRGVFEKARELALGERRLLISESHLVRSHMDRVADTTKNIYEQLGINTARLRDYLAHQTEDRAKAVASKEMGVIEDIEGYLLSRVINQEQAIYTVLPALKAMRAGLNEPGQLMGVFLFLGATGVGKTELARTIADVAFESKPGVKDPYLIFLDCGRLGQPGDIVQLLGAPQGFVGYGEGRLTNGLREKPRSVILFDEAEKANKAIWQSLLTFFDEGMVHEADGKAYDATGCILVATSNLGYKEAMERFDLWQATPEQQEKVRREVEEHVWTHVRDYFSPEFLGRFGRENVIFFNHFSKQAYRAMIRRQIDKLCQEMAQRGFELSADDRVDEYLTDLAWENRGDGARPVRRLVSTHLRNQIVSALGEDPNRVKFYFTFAEGSGRVVLKS